MPAGNTFVPRMKRAFLKYLFSVAFLLLGTLLHSYANSVPGNNELLSSVQKVHATSSDFNNAQFIQGDNSLHLDFEKLLIEETESENLEFSGDTDDLPQIYSGQLFTAAFYLMAWDFSPGNDVVSQSCRKESTHHSLRRFIQLEVFRI